MFQRNQAEKTYTLKTDTAGASATLAPTYQNKWHVTQITTTILTITAMEISKPTN
jgi:hypothetical protein